MLDMPGFRPERCVRYRYAYSECERCADACPHGAIRLFDAGVEVQASRCQSCALCVSACQTEALHQARVSAGHLLKAADGSKRMTIVCTPSQAEADATVPCLGALHPVVLADLSRQGVAVELAGTEHCAGCAHVVKAADMMRASLQAHELLCGAGDFGRDAPLTLRADAPDAGKREQPDMSRRSLFRRVAGHGADVLSGRFDAAPAPLKVIRAVAPFVPERKVLLNAMFAEAGEAAVTLARHDAIPAEDWKVAGGCSHCEACVRVCPTGAMQLLENNSAWRLAFLNDRCVACDVCAEACQPGVLRQTDTEAVIINRQKGRLLAAVSKRRCALCDRVFVDEGGGETCPICSGDDEDFSSIFG